MRHTLLVTLLALTLSASDVRYDGAKVHYESHGKGAEALVFIHGWTCDLTFWRGQEPVYTKHRSLLVDLPGHGKSDKPDVSYTQERFARAIEAAMRAAGVERGILIGHSMGGPVALTFLRLFPAKTKALVLVDAYVPRAPQTDAERSQHKQMEAFAARWRAADYKASATAMIESMFSAKTPAPLRTEITTKMLATPQHVMASAFEGMVGLEPLKPGETFNVPVMAVMTGGASGGPGYEAQLKTAFPKLVKFEAWEGSGHFLMMESPDRFNQVLEDFLASLK